MLSGSRYFDAQMGRRARFYLEELGHQLGRCRRRSKKTLKTRAPRFKGRAQFLVERQPLCTPL
jgi:hypothetical protein